GLGMSDFDAAMLEAEREQVREAAEAMGLPRKIVEDLAADHHLPPNRRLLRAVHAASDGGLRAFVAFRVILKVGLELLDAAGQIDRADELAMGVAATVFGPEIIKETWAYNRRPPDHGDE